jgi:hypothetical protein
MSPARRAALLLVAAAWPGVVLGQVEGPRLSGYLEHQLSVARAPSGWGHIDYDRLRLDIDASAGRGMTASAAVVWQLYRGRTTASLADLVPADLRGQVPADAEYEIRERQYLNHAYIALYAGPATITAGKQHLAWGSGMVFNPTELFRPKALFDPTYEREGVGALAVALETGALSDVEAVYVPEDDWRTSAKVARVRGHLAGFDLSALAAEVWETDPVPALLEGTPATPEHRVVVGGDISGELPGVGIWAEGTWSRQDDARWVELTVGGNTTLPGNILLTVEGYLDGRGRTGEPYPVEDWLAVATGTRRTIGRGLVFGSISRPTGDLLSLALAALASASDGSAALLPSARYAFAENVDLFLQLIVTAGPDGTEFGTRGSGGLIRGRVYF